MTAIGQPPFPPVEFGPFHRDELPGLLDAHARAVAHVRKVAQHVRSAELRAAFLRRPMVLKIMRQAGVEPPSADELAPPESKAVPSSRARAPEST